MNLATIGYNQWKNLAHTSHIGSLQAILGDVYLYLSQYAILCQIWPAHGNTMANLAIIEHPWS